MAIQIDKNQFRLGHGTFLKHMQEQGDGVPFTSFGHRFFITDEVAYKSDALRRGREVLQFDKWPKWLKTPGKITEALKEACQSGVSHNLMEHRYGEAGSYSTLYRLDSETAKRSFEEQALALFESSKATEQTFGEQFDRFTEHLRSHHLGCKWDFLAYLIFLMRPERCFPIRSSHFENVLRFYGVEEKITGKVTWQRYQTILAVADALKVELSVYGSPTAIEIQSYMWVISYLLPKIDTNAPQPTAFDFTEELLTRQKREMEKQRIGLLGEQFILNSEKQKLTIAGRADLAKEVRLVAIENDSCGYDVLSFSVNGDEIHIEVKTTTQGQRDSDCFWLSANEVQKASIDPKWTLFRVWNIDASPFFDELGNIVLCGHSEWDRTPSAWVVRRFSREVTENSTFT
jgi:hypothetical protein